MKIKCIKLECPQCKTIGLAQVFLRKDSTVRYIRFRHYLKLDAITRKPQFEYHSIENLPVYLQELQAKGINLSGQDSGQSMMTTNSKVSSLNPKIQVSQVNPQGSSSSTDYDTGLRSRRSWVRIPAGPPIHQ